MLKKTILILAFVLTAGALVFAGGQKEPTALTKMTFITPRGTIEVMDDYNLWVAIEMGYFKELGLDVVMEGGPGEAFAPTKFVDQKQADVGYPSPGILTSSVDTGMDVVMVYEMMIDQVFGFAVRKDSPIKSIKDFPGKTMSVWDVGWQAIIDPILIEAGIDPKSITYVAVGAQWGQAVSQGKADIALMWKGQGPQWDSIGLGLRYFKGEDFSKMPANGYCARKSDLKDPAKKALLVKFLKGTSMGIHFARSNPRAAAQIVYSKFAAVREQMKPELALKSMQELHWGYTAGVRKGQGYGWFEMNGWKTYLDIISKLGQTKRLLTLEETVTNELIKEANAFDHAKVERDAKNFKLNDVWKDVPVTGDW
jgi:NitT/TauT family transport system substrate-binding protein